MSQMLAGATSGLHGRDLGSTIVPEVPGMGQVAAAPERSADVEGRNISGRLRLLVKGRSDAEQTDAANLALESAASSSALVRLAAVYGEGDTAFPCDRRLLAARAGVLFLDHTLRN